MSGEEAMKTIEHVDDPGTAARHLVSTATSNPKCTDNITVIVVFL
jgi:serine/threonine protein phosphatase PrpC